MGDVVPIGEATRHAREALLARHLAARNAGEIDALLDTFAEPRVELIPSGRVLNGRDEVRAYLEDRHVSFPDLHVEPVALHHADDAVVAEFTMTGTHRGDFHGIEATGRRFRIRGCSIYLFTGDRIGTQRLYYDAGTIARQLA